MIGRIRGALISRQATEVMVEAGGVGYSLQVSSATAARLPALEEEVTLWVTTRFRDDLIQLYGFAERREQEMFLRLLKVSGVGPKLAFAIISGGDVGRLEAQLIEGEVDELCKLPGVGKKLSKRLILELGEALKKELGDEYRPGLSAGGSNAEAAAVIEQELLAALEALGYRRQEVEKAARAKLEAAPGAGLETLLKLVLQELHRG
jgi:Holliday junction DNA helicase RuvA